MDPWEDPLKAARIAAEIGSLELKRAMNAAFGKFAAHHGIRLDQARGLLMDRKALA
jgi:hypothetical protein